MHTDYEDESLNLTTFVHARALAERKTPRSAGITLAPCIDLVKLTPVQSAM